jgi:hypothetical protein
VQDGMVMFPDFLPASLLEKGVAYHFSMARSRPDNYAWDMEAAIEVITTLADHGHAILGGDVLRLREGQLEYTGKYWDLVDEDVILWDEYVEETKGLSVRYVEDIARERGGPFLFTIFFLDEKHHRRQLRDFGNIIYR